LRLHLGLQPRVPEGPVRQAQRIIRLLVLSIGADDVIDYTRDEIDCHGARYDVVIDTAGNRPLSLLRRTMTPHGTLVLVGGEHGGGRVLGGFDRQLLRAPLVSMFAGQRPPGGRWR
jgi:NADPH:quinone reductase-like Zn-dependent oxidoreductase